MARAKPFAPRRGSVRMRVTAAAMLVLGFILIAGSCAGVFLQRRELTNSVQTVATQQLDTVRARPNTLGPSTDDGSVIQIVDGSSAVVRSSGAAITGRPLVADPGLDPVVAELSSVGGESDRFLVVARRISATHPGRGYVVVARSLEAVDQATTSAIGLLSFGVPGLLLVVGLVSYRLVGAALAPVEELRAAVADVRSGDLSQRVPEPATHDEIHRLSKTLNQLLSELERSTAQQRQFVADASHELRSPVAGLRANLEVTQLQWSEAPPPQPWASTWQEYADAATAEVVRLQQILDDLLLLARSGRAKAKVQAIDVKVLVFEATQVGRRVPVHLCGLDQQPVAREQLLVMGSRLGLERVLRNLLDNAERHAATRIDVNVIADLERITIRVDDDGNGIAEADRERIFERFLRLDEARARDAGGSGLGLAIAREVTEQHSGTLRAIPGDGGRFEWRLPRSG